MEKSSKQSKDCFLSEDPEAREEALVSSRFVFFFFLNLFTGPITTPTPQSSKTSIPTSSKQSIIKQHSAVVNNSNHNTSFITYIKEKIERKKKEQYKDCFFKHTITSSNDICSFTLTCIMQKGLASCVCFVYICMYELCCIKKNAREEQIVKWKKNKEKKERLNGMVL